MSPYKHELYNGLVETATRSLIVLTCFYPYRLTAEAIRMLEFHAVYGEDVGMDESLQRRCKGRAQAFVFREEKVKEGLEFLVDAGQAEGDWQQGYKAIRRSVDDFMVSLEIGSNYISSLYQTCFHMSELAEKVGLETYLSDMAKDLTERVSEPLERPDDPKFDGLLASYKADILRMEGLANAASAFSMIPRNHIKTSHPKLETEWLSGLDAAAMKEVESIKLNLAGLEQLRADMAQD